jgi:hypothetical protein
MSHDSRKEAEVLGRYLLGKRPDEKSISLYCEAMAAKPVTLNAREEKLFRFLLRNPWSAGMIDSALAFSRTRSAVRRKILFMSAILETRPEYAKLFLPQERSWTYNIYIFWVGSRAVMKMVAGKILLLFI